MKHNTDAPAPDLEAAPDLPTHLASTSPPWPTTTHATTASHPVEAADLEAADLEPTDVERACVRFACSADQLTWKGDAGWQFDPHVADR